MLGVLSCLVLSCLVVYDFLVFLLFFWLSLVSLNNSFGNELGFVQHPEYILNNNVEQIIFVRDACKVSPIELVSESNWRIIFDTHL